MYCADLIFTILNFVCTILNFVFTIHYKFSTSPFDHLGLCKADWPSSVVSNLWTQSWILSLHWIQRWIAKFKCKYMGLNYHCQRIIIGEGGGEGGRKTLMMLICTMNFSQSRYNHHHPFTYCRHFTNAKVWPKKFPRSVSCWSRWQFGSLNRPLLWFSRLLFAEWGWLGNWEISAELHSGIWNQDRLDGLIPRIGPALVFESFYSLT